MDYGLTAYGRSKYIKYSWGNGSFYAHYSYKMCQKSLTFSSAKQGSLSPSLSKSLSFWTSQILKQMIHSYGQLYAGGGTCRS